jgi:hypothetical protein
MVENASRCELIEVERRSYERTQAFVTSTTRVASDGIKGPRHPWRSLGRRSREREESAGTTVARP